MLEVFPIRSPIAPLTLDFFNLCTGNPRLACKDCLACAIVSAPLISPLRVKYLIASENCPIDS